MNWLKQHIKNHGDWDTYKTKVYGIDGIEDKKYYPILIPGIGLAKSKLCNPYLIVLSVHGILFSI
jgi:hypothetical protein